MDWTKPHVQDAVKNQFGRLYGNFRNKCHQHYKKYGGGASGRANPPVHFLERRDDWVWICDNIFDNEDWKVSKYLYINFC